MIKLEQSTTYEPLSRAEKHDFIILLRKEGFTDEEIHSILSAMIDALHKDKLTEDIFIDNSRNPRSDEYDEYLTKHINGVLKSWNEQLRPYLESKLTDSDAFLPDYNENDLNDIESQIKEHDKSKYDSDEYDAYLNWFYPTDDFPKDPEEFNRAWLHHQHHNPHHWQHWCLIRDEDSNDIVKLEMPFNYICEMLCDWSSFKYMYEGSTARKWFYDNEDNILLNSNTKELVVKILDECDGL